jgi:hypothetical protein
MGELVLKERVDKTETENKESPHKAQSKGRAFFEFPNDPASIESKAGRIPNNGANVQGASSA